MLVVGTKSGSSDGMQLAPTTGIAWRLQASPQRRQGAGIRYAAVAGVLESHCECWRQVQSPTQLTCPSCPPPCPSAFPARSCVGHCSPLNDCAVELKEGDLVKM